MWRARRSQLSTSESDPSLACSEPPLTVLRTAAAERPFEPQLQHCSDPTPLEPPALFLACESGRVI